MHNSIFRKFTKFLKKNYFLEWEINNFKINCIILCHHYCYYFPLDYVFNSLYSIVYSTINQWSCWTVTGKGYKGVSGVLIKFCSLIWTLTGVFYLQKFCKSDLYSVCCFLYVSNAPVKTRTRFKSMSQRLAVKFPPY